LRGESLLEKLDLFGGEIPLHESRRYLSPQGRGATELRAVAGSGLRATSAQDQQRARQQGDGNGDNGGNRRRVRCVVSGASRRGRALVGHPDPVGTQEQG